MGFMIFDPEYVVKAFIETLYYKILQEYAAKIVMGGDIFRSPPPPKACCRAFHRQGSPSVQGIQLKRPFP